MEDKYLYHCGNCRYYTAEDVFGWGWCNLFEESMYCSETCCQGKRRDNPEDNKTEKPKR